jgi:pyruvate,water dikinase
MTSYVLSLDEIDRSSVAVVGGKGANLGALSRVEGIEVPDGFCVTTDAFRRITENAPAFDRRLDALAQLKWEDRDVIRTLSEELRETLETARMPSDLTSAIAGRHSRVGEHLAYAVRSSASGEDSATLSFAGQHDSYLNVRGLEVVLRHIQRCWASLFTERAVTYRLRHGHDHRKARMAVVVQKMVFPQMSGVLFTADPATGSRKVTAVEASFGFGDALVSGLVNTDTYKVRGGAIIAKTIRAKGLAIRPLPEGGTHRENIDSSRQTLPALTDSQVLRLEQLGRRIEAHFGTPQDIEWCSVNDSVWVVQSRPITTLFPIPVAGDRENHVYLSVGHAQMMTDPMKPLGISMWQRIASRPMAEAGGRLFVDVTHALASPASRPGLLEMVGRSDPLAGNALQTILDRGDFVSSQPNERATPTPPVGGSAPIDADPAVVAALIERAEASVEAMEHEIGSKSGTDLLDFILADIQELKRFLFDPQSSRVFMTAIEATWWLNDHLQTWLSERNAADALTQSVPNNVTSEMGLALLDVADAIRPYPEVVAFLRHARHEDFLDELPKLAGGREAQDAIRRWLENYGMRCVGEIDITRPRWSERPTTLLPVLLGNVKNFDPGAARRRFEQGRQQAQKKEHDALERLRALPDGERKAEETKCMIDRVRTFIGYREYPKYHWVSRTFVYKRALLAEAGRLVKAGVLREKEDIFFLTVEELHDVVRTRRVNDQLVREREEAFQSHQALTPPRVLTSDGENIAGSYRRRDLPDGALVGLAVSAGTVEGRARVILDMAKAELEADDILVTVFTDPSWTPLFLAIKGLVTEVGGLMTHGAVIAREYGLPAVVGVENATTLIRDGQRIRLNGTDGAVEILS